MVDEFWRGLVGEMRGWGCFVVGFRWGGVPMYCEDYVSWIGMGWVSVGVVLVVVVGSIGE